MNIINRIGYDVLVKISVHGVPKNKTQKVFFYKLSVGLCSGGEKTNTADRFQPNSQQNLKSTKPS